MDWFDGLDRWMEMVEEDSGVLVALCIWIYCSVSTIILSRSGTDSLARGQMDFAFLEGEIRISGQIFRNEKRRRENRSRPISIFFI